MYTIAVGNAFDGLMLHGIFDTSEEANEYADVEFKNENLAVVEIMST